MAPQRNKVWSRYHAKWIPKPPEGETYEERLRKMRMTFGKYDDCLVIELPTPYLRFLLTITIHKRDLRDAVKAELDARELKSKQQSKEPAKDDRVTFESDTQIMISDIVDTGYRKLALELHPDHGGDTRGMQLLNAAVKRLREVSKGRY